MTNVNTNALKLFAQQTRSKLVSSIKTKMQWVLTEDSAELRGKQNEINQLRKEIAEKSQNNENGEEKVIEEVAYTWFNRVMALRFMDANGYNIPMVITPGEGLIRPEILQEAMGGNVDEALQLTADDLQHDEEFSIRSCSWLSATTTISRCLSSSSLSATIPNSSCPTTCCQNRVS